MLFLPRLSSRVTASSPNLRNSAHSFAFARGISNTKKRTEPKLELIASDPVVHHVALPVDSTTQSQSQHYLQGEAFVDNSFGSSSTISYTRETFGALSPTSPRVVVVAIHGTLGSHRDFRYIAGAFSEMRKEKVNRNDTNGDDSCDVVIAGSVGKSIGLSKAISVELLRIDLPGYGDSKVSGCRLEAPADSDYFAETVWKFLDVLYPPTAKENKTRFILLAHSLGGHAAVAMTAQRREAVQGIGFIASIGLRPHRGIGGRIYSLFCAMDSQLHHPYFGPMVKSGMHWGYTNIGGFSRKNSVEDILHSHKRVVSLDFEGIGVRVKSLWGNDGVPPSVPPTTSSAQSSVSSYQSSSSTTMSNTTPLYENIPCFHAYAADDPHIEESVQVELAKALPDGPRLRFETGGHNIQKTRSIELARSLWEWIEALKNIR